MKRKKMVYVDDEVHAKLKEQADQAGTTINNVLRQNFGLMPAPLEGGRKAKV